jgi:cupin fold WbuC family metalloprotein
MIKIYSKVDPNVLCHMVLRKDEIVEERTDIISPDNFLQLSTLNMKEGKTFRPHKHIWKPGEEQVIAQESWVVIQGKVKVFFFDTDGKSLQEELLHPGDSSITLQGGHTYLSMEDETKVYEFKTGPYKGQKLDKVFLDEL